MRGVVAFDVSKGHSYMVIYDRQKHCIFEEDIKHSLSAFEEIRIRIESQMAQDGVMPYIVFEATGVYSKALERFMRECGFEYALMNPLEAKMQSLAMRMHKTDRTDAHKLAQSCFTHPPQNKTFQESYYEEMRSLSRHYAELEKETTRLKTRIHALVQMTFPELEDIFSRTSGLYLSILQLFPHPEMLKELSRTKVKNLILNHTEKRQSRQRAEEKADSLLMAAADAYPALSVQDVRVEQLQNYAKRCQELLDLKQTLIKQMVSLSQDRAEYHILRSFPGIGDITAVRIIAEAGDIRRFNTSKQLNAFAGIDIRRYQSGTILYKDKINRRGNKHLRKILYFTIENMIRAQKSTDNHLVDYYQKLKKQPHDKHHKVACIACVNKFLKCLFHLVRTGQRYDYAMATNHRISS